MMDNAGLEGLRNACGESWQVVDFGNGDEFDWLWSSEDAPEGCWNWLSNGEKQKNLLVVWDSMPANLDVSPINITDQLTPFDWVVSISHRLLAQETPAFRVLILDCYSSIRKHAFGCRMADSLIAAFPWLGVVRLLATGDARSAADQWGASKFKEIAADPTVLGALNADPVGTRATVDSFVQAWVGNLARSATHHDVNNLLGPLILLEGLGLSRKAKERGRSALLQHARWLGIVRSNPPRLQQEIGWFDPRPLADELNRTIRFILVDDQANNGWKDVIAAVVGVYSREGHATALATENKFNLLASAGRVELWGTTGATPVLDRLDQVLNTLNDAAQDFRFGLQLTPVSAQENTTGEESPLEVLLLDLRLASSKEIEIRNFRRVVTLAENLAKRNTDKEWPWRPLSASSSDEKSALQDLRSWLEKYENAPDDGTSQPSAEYLALLTLFARVVATLDMSLPIIVFSSTGQRRVMEELKGYENIITVFEKPRFAGYSPEDIIIESMDKWATAAQRAAALLRARSSIQGMREDSVLSPAREIRHERNGYLIELYVDETGNEFKDESLTIGGLLVAGPRHNVISFGDELKKKVDEIAHQAPDQNSGGIKTYLRSQGETLAALVNDLGEEKDVYCAVVTISGNLNTGAVLELQVGAVEDELEADNLYREMFSMLVEISVYHFAPEFCGIGVDTKYRVHMPTRVRGISDAVPQEVNYAENLKRDWGTKTKYVGTNRQLWDAIDALRELPDPDLAPIRKSLEEYASVKLGTDPAKFVKRTVINYLDFDAGRPLVQGVSRQYRVEAQPKPERARAYILDAHIRETRRAHLLADVFIDRFAARGALTLLKDRGFAGEYCVDLRRLLRGARQATNGFFGDGLAIAAKSARVVSSANKSDIRRRLLAKLYRFAAGMSGAEFMRMVNSHLQPDAIKDGIVTKRFGRDMCAIELKPDGQLIECQALMNFGKEHVSLQRGDRVQVVVSGLIGPGQGRLNVSKLVAHARHRKWEDLKIGESVKGAIMFVSNHLAHIKLDIGLDGTVRLGEVPVWRSAAPDRGAKFDFTIVDINTDRGLLRLAPVL
jgi:hypothetical protein